MTRTSHLTPGLLTGAGLALAAVLAIGALRPDALVEASLGRALAERSAPPMAAAGDPVGAVQLANSVGDEKFWLTKVGPDLPLPAPRLIAVGDSIAIAGGAASGAAAPLAMRVVDVQALADADMPASLAGLGHGLVLVTSKIGSGPSARTVRFVMDPALPAPTAPLTTKPGQAL